MQKTNNPDNPNDLTSKSYSPDDFFGKKFPTLEVGNLLYTATCDEASRYVIIHKFSNNLVAVTPADYSEFEAGELLNPEPPLTEGTLDPSRIVPRVVLADKTFYPTPEEAIIRAVEYEIRTCEARLKELENTRNLVKTGLPQTWVSTDTAEQLLDSEDIVHTKLDTKLIVPIEEGPVSKGGQNLGWPGPPKPEPKQVKKKKGR